MEVWQITYSGRTCEAEPIEEKVKQDYPTLLFGLDEKMFSIEFSNRSDYMAARDSSVAVRVKVINADRSKYFDGAAVKLKI